MWHGPWGAYWLEWLETALAGNAPCGLQCFWCRFAEAWYHHLVWRCQVPSCLRLSRWVLPNMTSTCLKLAKSTVGLYKDYKASASNSSDFAKDVPHLSHWMSSHLCSCGLVLYGAFGGAQIVAGHCHWWRICQCIGLQHGTCSWAPENHLWGSDAPWSWTLVISYHFMQQYELHRGCACQWVLQNPTVHPTVHPHFQ